MSLDTASAPSSTLNFTDSSTNISEDSFTTQTWDDSSAFHFENEANSTDDVQLGIYYTIGIIGVVGNGIVIIVLSSSEKIRTKIVNIFLINQSILDFLTAVFLIASAKNDYEQQGHYGLIGELYCRLWSMKVPMWSTFMSSTYNLVALTLERYMEVIHPIKHRISFTRSHAFAILAAVWLIGPVYNFPLTGLTSTSKDGQCSHMTEWPRVEVRMVCGVMTFFLEFFLPLAIMIAAYTKMAKALQGKVHPSDATTKATKIELLKQKARRNVIRTLVLVTLCFFICWVWNQVFFLLFNLGYPTKFGTTFYSFTVYSAFVNCCINPFVYTAQYKDFQTQAKKLLKITDTTVTVMEQSVNTTKNS